jgi:hypothetical protein
VADDGKTGNHKKKKNYGEKKKKTFKRKCDENKMWCYWRDQDKVARVVVAFSKVEM